MRLLSAKTLKLIDFPPDQIPTYVILSHTWGVEEILLSDIEDPTATRKKGWHKVKSACAQVIKDGFQYVWIDTCCIDKTSSAELSEALNSMFLWYTNADLCYAYLSDVPRNCDPYQERSEFEKSRWFTRGWTLQELLAPREIVFFSHEWEKIGTKRTLAATLSRITNIDEEVIEDPSQLDSVSIAKRMSWAAHRKTTRPEDAAYCLMGIFSVNMPMMYGEGEERAFIRLQEKIMTQDDDRSIFAWYDPKAEASTHHGLLATSPAQFAFSHNIVAYRAWESHDPFSMTNRGLHIDLPIVYDKVTDTYLASLDCVVETEDNPYSGFVSIVLKRVSSMGDQYVRTSINQLMYIDARGKPTPLYVYQKIAPSSPRQPFPMPVFELPQSSAMSKNAVLFVRKGVRVELPNPALKMQRFSSNKGSRRMDICIVFSTSSGVTVVVMLAMQSANLLTFGAFEHTDRRSWSVKDIPYLSEKFQPQALGTWVRLVCRRVRVMAEIREKHGRRWCSVTTIAVREA
ncbi:hypothetical protein ANOM_008868 [Aspergillus nomiae NRRL 13137]|uniref:Uncharacterized protein n=1 Tax=Aspergillus nomiae NRRL (strain ATCC 15546 / NRRL 13137 / CBS 260.88 / M93) TaxID=1509407 RepID=A0A0L1IQV6_ASPN3|nr:uncharacterized protein ANOM_008868 [Aspergillus nomiae NRRL 13137]KNG81941.1 hypothetical protein ANOM_008868 [Aspergillus nomiae NRRL 13137]